MKDYEKELQYWMYFFIRNKQDKRLYFLYYINFLLIHYIIIFLCKKAVVSMYRYLNKKFILDINSGVCHDFSNITINCQIYKVDLSDIFESDYLHKEIKKHLRYKEKGIYCIREHFSDQ
jgi:hypothetical protein